MNLEPFFYDERRSNKNEIFERSVLSFSCFRRFEGFIVDVPMVDPWMMRIMSLGVCFGLKA